MLLSTHALSYRYPQAAVNALDNLSLEVPRGAFALLAGASGCGKSTLLRCFNGLVPHFSGGKISGQVRVAGLNPVQVGPQGMSRQVGFVFQNPEAQFVVGRVEDEVAFALENQGMPPQEMRARVAETLHMLDLWALRGREIHTLSGGEQQRVAIAAALVLRPSLLVLDEPTSQLDPHAAGEVLTALQRLQQTGLTILLAEHRLERILPLADYLIVLEPGGKLGWYGPLADGLERLPFAPPLIRLGRALGWRPLPRSVEAARRFAAHLPRPAVVPPPAAAPAPHPQALRVTALEAGYDGDTVLHGINLEVRPGELLALLGHNGSGKSTLLKVIMGLIPPVGGAVTLSGKDLRAWSTVQRARHIAYLPQNPDALLFSQSVLDEWRVTLRNHGLPINQGALYALAECLGLRSLLARYPRDLSAGERQRVALGAVTVTHPAFLLLDEPTRGLDAPSKHRLGELLHAWRQAGMGILLVTHDVELAARLADRVAVLAEGRLHAIGAPLPAFQISPDFAPQTLRLFPDAPWLTPEDVLSG
ncbi:MAG: ATP-binding cassette domain-containing protein [Anaerolineales bacterium]